MPAVAMEEDINQQLISAAKYGNTSEVKKFIEQGANINAVDPHENTALHWAIYKENVEVVKFLLEKGAFINARDKWGRRTLYLATRAANIPIIDMILNAGATLNISENDRQTPSKSDADVDAKELIHVMKITKFVHTKQLSEKLAFLLAKGAASPQYVLNLVNAGADINLRVAIPTRTRSRKKATYPLIEAARMKSQIPREDNVDLVKLLIQLGANVNAEVNGVTPLMVASEANHGSLVIPILLEHGAKINEEDNDGYTALDYALEAGNLTSESAKLLKAAGAKEGSHK